MLISIASSPRYLYGLREAPSDSNHPAGKIELIPLTKARTLTTVDERDYRHGIVVYDRPLTHFETDRYGLTDLNVSSETTIWNTFVTFVRELRHVSPDYTLDQFVKDYIASNGSRVKENPLYKFLKPSSPLVFTYLRKFTKFEPNYKGLTKFWESAAKR